MYPFHLPQVLFIYFRGRLRCVLVPKLDIGARTAIIELISRSLQNKERPESSSWVFLSSVKSGRILSEKDVQNLLDACSGMRFVHTDNLDSSTELCASILPGPV